MGTGIPSILLHNFPYNDVWLRYISYILFTLNMLVFILLSLISLLRYMLYQEMCAGDLLPPLTTQNQGSHRLDFPASRATRAG